uniref:Zgc:77262 n=1 Tax=Hucho hucho TaxID=62062 RepID=A0A4W5MYB0_9TELE
MVKMIFVGNVNSLTTEPELRTLFEKYGPVSDCDILKNDGFVHMNKEAAQKAVVELNKHELNGARITVEFATTKVRNATKIYVGNVPEGTTADKSQDPYERRLPPLTSCYYRERSPLASRHTWLLSPS